MNETINESEYKINAKTIFLLLSPAWFLLLLYSILLLLAINFDIGKWMNILSLSILLGSPMLMIVCAAHLSKNSFKRFFVYLLIQGIICAITLISIIFVERTFNLADF